MGLSVITYALAKKYTDEKFSKFIGFNIQIVDTLPLTDIDTHTIYFVKRTSPSGEADYYYEYMYINNKWELIGSTELDLTNYYTKDEVQQYVADHAYTLPIATEYTLGGIKLDPDTMEIDSDGTLSVSDSHLEETSAEVAQETIDNNFSSITSSEIGNLFL